MIIFSRKERKERKVLFTFRIPRLAGVVANFVTTRVRREFYPPPPPCGVLPLSQGEKRTPPQPSPVWEGVVTTDLCPISRTLYSPPSQGERGL